MLEVVHQTSTDMMNHIKLGTMWDVGDVLLRICVTQPSAHSLSVMTGCVATSRFHGSYDYSLKWQ